MQNEELDRGGAGGGEEQRGGTGEDLNSNKNPNSEEGEGEDVEMGWSGSRSRENHAGDRTVAPAVLGIVISQPEEAVGPKGSAPKATASDRAVAPAVLGIVISQPDEAVGPKGSAPKATASDKDDKAAAARKGFLPRSESYHEQCRVCQQQTDEPLMDLGCRCRGELAKAHRSCIDIWFRTRGSNKCEICQQVAANVPSPESQPSTNYWVWRVDPAFGGSNMGRGERGRGCFSPLWVAFSILIGGLLLDVLISVSLGVSALPVNIIIGVLIVLGLGTALRLALECCHEWSTRRNLQRADATVNPGSLPAI